MNPGRGRSADAGGGKLYGRGATTPRPTRPAIMDAARRRRDVRLTVGFFAAAVLLGCCCGGTLMAAIVLILPH